MTAAIEKQALLYTGKAKAMYATNDPEILWVEYLDQATALNGKRKVPIDQKGRLNNRIASLIFKDLANHALPTILLSNLQTMCNLSVA